MKLNDLLSRISVVWSSNVINLDITDVEYDSRCVQEGNLFFAIKGLQDDGNLFIQEAIENGAVAVIASREYYELATSAEGLSNSNYEKSFAFVMEKNIPLIITEDPVEDVSFISAYFYNYPSRDLNVIGITGTNGKTSITYFLETILNATGYRAGVVGSVSYRYAGKEIDQIEYTTPKSLYLQRIIKTMKLEGVSHLAMEVSSHGIELGRVSNIDFDVAIYTNLSREHMDFHSDMEDYFEVKKRFFTQLLVSSTKKKKVAIVNIDCEYGRKLVEILKLMKEIDLYTYGFSTEADLWVDEYKLSDQGSSFTLRVDEKEYNFNIPLIGRHSIYNAMAALTLAINVYGIDIKKLQGVFDDKFVIPGRLERVLSGHNVFVDYAHTDDALQNIFVALRNVFPNKKIITVFGCGGDRDKGKRPKMGKVVSDLSDYAIVTSDNPRDEDPKIVIDSIVAGMRPKGYEVELNRKSAIEKAIANYSQSTDVILIAGKGHETYQLIKGVKYDFDDRKIAINALKSFRNAQAVV